MRIDHFVEIGTSHQTCQDSVTSGIFESPDYPPRICIALSDGCSSSDNAELASQLCIKAGMATVAENDLDILLDPSKFRLRVREKCMNALKSLGDLEDNFFATLLIAFFVNKDLHIYGFGDGVIAIDDGKFLKVHDISYDLNMPFYPYYDTLIERDFYQQALIANGKQIKSKATGLITIAEGEDTICETVRDFFYEPTHIVIKDYAFKSVTLFSDGISSICHRNNGSIMLVDKAVKEFTAYKNFAGDFVKRRCKAALKEFKKHDLANYDDLAVATIYNEDFCRK